ncbi:hypothetical protein F4779DRAFT_640069 [Xylariaceae sp. FL0662B]|nr:hypothetical protein F4779DRAFT_640069 [Xylariaceae sp. FL0662B]
MSIIHRRSETMQDNADAESTGSVSTFALAAFSLCLINLGLLFALFIFVLEHGGYSTCAPSLYCPWFWCTPRPRPQPSPEFQPLYNFTGLEQRITRMRGQSGLSREQWKFYTEANVLAVALAFKDVCVRSGVKWSTILEAIQAVPAPAPVIHEAGAVVAERRKDDDSSATLSTGN